jgi:quercetin dioxygenase-like cupin family protein
MIHPSVIRPAEHAAYSTSKMGKSTIFESPRLLVGLNAFEPGQEHALHAHAGQDKV